VHEHVDVRERRVELLHEPYTQALRAQVLHRGNGPRRPEDRRPRATPLAHEQVVLLAARKLVEGRRGLGGQCQEQRVQRVLRQRDLDDRVTQRAQLVHHGRELVVAGERARHDADPTGDASVDRA
jgi:hypothetical protein